MSTNNQSPEQRIAQLEMALKTTLAAIDALMRTGCVDHMDCWDEAQELWYEPLEIVRAIAKEIP